MFIPCNNKLQGGHKLMAIILSNLNQFTNFFTGRFLGIFGIICRKLVIKNPLSDLQLCKYSPILLISLVRNSAINLS